MASFAEMDSIWKEVQGKVIFCCDKVGEFEVQKPQFSNLTSRNLGMLFHLPTAFLRVAGCKIPASSHSVSVLPCLHVDLPILTLARRGGFVLCHIYTYI